MTASEGSDRRNLIDRLLEEPVTPPPEAQSRRTASVDVDTELPAPPANATFVVQDDWDTNRGLREAGSAAARNAIPSARRVLGTTDATARHVLRLAIFALAVIGAAAGLVVAWFHVTTDPLADARAYYDAAARLNAGHALYPAGIDPSTNLAYLYPPLLAVVLRPLALLGYTTFALLWEVVVLAAFVLLLRRLGVRSQRTWLAIGILGIPIGWALAVAQAHVPLTLLLAIGQPWSIALATNLKLFPILIVLFWIGRRDWETVVAFAGWMALFALVQVALEPNGSFAYLGTVGLGQLGQVRNISPFAISPELWLIALAVGIGAALVLARTRWGWPAAVALATLASPRLLVYMLMSLLAAVREPEGTKAPAAQPQPWLLVSGGGRH